MKVIRHEQLPEPVKIELKAENIYDGPEGKSMLEPGGLGLT